MEQAVTARKRKEVYLFRHILSQADIGSVIKTSGHPISIERLSKKYVYIYVSFSESEKVRAKNRLDYREKVADKFLKVIDLARIAGFKTITEKLARNTYTERLLSRKALMETISARIKALPAEKAVSRPKRKRSPIRKDKEISA